MGLLKKIKMGNGAPLFLIAGPCVIENEKITLSTAEAIKKITDELGIQLIFKASYKKANRTNVNSFVGINFEKALRILEKVKKNFSLPILTDIHSENEIEAVASVVDILQIPAFLCRQTDLILTAARTHKAINVKKGQFLAPTEMKHIIEKIESVKNKKILLTERGTTFGYNNLIVDMRSLEFMKEYGYPVIMDATHAVQIPGAGKVTGGEPRFISTIAKAAAAVGIDGLFLEVHPSPHLALSDSASQLHLNKLKPLLEKVKLIDEVAKRDIA
ncbi:MAG: 3-deoxy-8-phosphooctulonate synthase [Melioribacteraceae bacterium]|jgi:2-dehydro-3-deoxyphosphooctonate aldolase (KDO 8-P synthase)|nr:3-deoxy-8-phosphooctulonate synthase [Melioribacteraceae bacterium]